MDWIVIVNPVSGKSRGKRLAESVVRFLAERGVTAEPVFTTGPGDGTRLARQAVAEGIRQVAVCGGDGTVHEVVNGLVGSDAVLGIVPSGRGNDLARVLGIPGDVESASAVLMDGVDRQIDLGRIGDRYFGTVATLGFDSVVARWTYDRGARFYVLAVLKTLRTYRCPTVRLEGDFGCFEGPILLVATGNGGFYGAGMQIVPQAMTVEGSVSEWEDWTGLSFPESGQYTVEGALQPVTIDREADVGHYADPNVWMRHPVSTR